MRSESLSKKRAWAILQDRAASVRRIGRARSSRTEQDCEARRDARDSESQRDPAMPDDPRAAHPLSNDETLLPPRC